MTSLTSSGLLATKTVRQLLLAASIAAFAPAIAAQAEPLQSAEVAALVGKQGFEFRSRYTVWKFSADGRVTADDSRVQRLVWGGAGEEFGIKKTGTWRLEGNVLYITWQDVPGEQRYVVNHGTGRLVLLAGPQQIEGTLEASGQPSYAEAPVQKPVPATNEPRGRYQRIPGPR